MSYKNLITEVLSLHADQILQQTTDRREYATLFPSQEELPSLLSLADQVQAALQPVNPPKAFRDQLQRDLLAAAHLRQATDEETATQSSFLRSPPASIALTLLLTLIIGLFFYQSKQLHDQDRPQI